MTFAHRIMICLTLMTAWGCQTEPNPISPNGPSTSDAQRTGTNIPASNMRLKQLFVRGNNGGLGPLFNDHVFTYDQGRRLQKVTAPTNTMSGTLTHEYTYDDQGRVSSYKTLNENPNYTGVIGKQSSFSFGNGTIVETLAQVQADGRILPPQQEPNLRITYKLNEQDQIIEQVQEGVIRFGSETSQRFLYTYENGNVVKLTMVNESNQVEFVIDYEYDDKVNPFYQLSYSSDPVLNGSRNNIISSSVNNNPPQRKEFTYNEQGLPLTQTYVSTGAVLTYEYESF